MTLYMAGVSAREAGAEARHELAGRLRGRAGVLLTTCHRVELYSTAPDADSRLGGIQAFEHLARVAAGLESAIPGEGEVLHQVREALAAAREQGPVEPGLARAFELAIAAGRQARAGLRTPPAGLAESAVQWLLEQRPGLGAGASVVVAGRGPMGNRLAARLAEAGARVIRTSRTPGPGILPLDEGARLARDASALAVALAGPWVELERLPEVPVADLSWPVSVSPAARATAGPWLDLDSITLAEADPDWTAAAEAAVAEAVLDYASWIESREAAPVITALLGRAEQRREQRVRRALRRMGRLDARQAELVEQLSRQLVADLLHEPLVALRAGSDETAVRRAFRL